MLIGDARAIMQSSTSGSHVGDDRQLCALDWETGTNPGLGRGATQDPMGNECPHHVGGGTQSCISIAIEEYDDLGN